MATSYTNRGGSGNRTSIVTVTQSSPTVLTVIGALSNLVDGDTADHNLFFNNSITLSSTYWFQFDFGAGQTYIIDEVKYYQSNTTAEGTWQFQGSNDGTNYVNIGSSFSLGGVATQTITAMSGNTSGYRYYRFLGVSGTTSDSPWVSEFEFKIDSGAYTVVKKIGSGQVYTTLAAWESDAPVDYTTAEKSAAGTFLVAAYTQGESLTFVGSGAAGKFLHTDSTGAGNGTFIVYSITSGNPAASDVVTGGSSGATCVLSSGTPQTTGVVWQGQINASSDNFTGTTNRLTIGGGTTSATAYLELTTATGASFADSIGVVRYDTTRGCYITNSGNGYQPCIGNNQSFSRLTKLQIYQSGTGSAVDSRNPSLTISRCIMEGNSAITSGGNPPFLCTDQTNMNNTIVIQRGSAKSSVAYIVSSLTVANFTNCTFAVPNDLTAATNFFEGGTVYTTINTKNCALFGASAFAASITFTHAGDYSNLTGTGVTQITYNTSAFVNITDATRDYRTVASGTLNAKVSYDTGFPTDIFGTSRPTGASASDPGCFQASGAAASTPHQLLTLGVGSFLLAFIPRWIMSRLGMGS